MPSVAILVQEPLAQTVVCPFSGDFVAMAGWERYKEDRKYGPDSGLVNVNHKHVGESLREITIEERIEERKRLKESQRKKMWLELDDESSVEETEEVRPAKVAKTTRPSLSGGDANAQPEDSKSAAEKAQEAAWKKLAEVLERAQRQAVRGMQESAQDLTRERRGARGLSRIPSRGNASALVEDLEAVDLDPPVEFPVVELDEVETSQQATDEVRKQRRKANVAKAKADAKADARAPPKRPIQVLETVAQVLEADSQVLEPEAPEVLAEPEAQVVVEAEAPQVLEEAEAPEVLVEVEAPQVLVEAAAQVQVLVETVVPQVLVEPEAQVLAEAEAEFEAEFQIPPPKRRMQAAAEVVAAPPKRRMLQVLE
jgi:hypothetical protein